MALDKTPVEIFLHILGYLEVEDVIALRKVGLLIVRFPEYYR